MQNQNQFAILAGYYDILNYNADYKKTADYIERVFEIYEKKPKLVLDLACGTGSLTVELDKRGYDMTGIDLSPEMLAVASAKKTKGDILWLNQSMQGFELYGTVDAIICCYDSLNYIPGEENIKKCFDLAHNYLNPGGLFIFDVNSRYKFENIYAKNNFILENKNIFCSWQNNYSKKNKICDFYINLFVMQSDGKYKRYYETQREYYHGEKFLKKTLGLSGFGDINIFGDFEAETEANAKSPNDRERLCFVAAKM